MATKFSEIVEEFKQVRNPDEYQRSFEIRSGKLLVADPYLLGWARHERLCKLFNKVQERELIFGGNTGIATLPNGIVYGTSKDGNYNVYDRGKSLESFQGMDKPPLKLQLVEIVEDGIPKKIVGRKNPNLVVGCDLATILIGDADTFVLPESKRVTRYADLDSELQLEDARRESAQFIPINPGTYTWRVHFYVPEGIYEESIDPLRIIRLEELPKK